MIEVLYGIKVRETLIPSKNLATQAGGKKMLCLMRR